MKAVVYEKYGTPEVLEIKEIDKPTPKENEVLIKIHATTVNRTDCGFRKPEYPIIIKLMNGFFTPKKKILGSELAGEVEATGKDVKSFKVGDKVFGLTGDRFGAHAEYICLPEDAAITSMPSNMKYEEAAVVCDGLMLAYNYLKEINFSSQKKILIYGASGSIGTAGIQLAKYFGAEVTAVCNTKNLDTVKSLGADEVIDYTKEDYTKSGEIYDVVFDAVGKLSVYHFKNILKKGGIYFSTDLGYMAQNPLLALVTKIFGNTPCGRKVLFPIPKASKKDIEFFKEIIQVGKYKAVIDKCYSLENIIDAHRYVETGTKTGNVVIKVI